MSRQPALDWLTDSAARDDATQRDEFRGVMELLFAAAGEFHGAVSVADALRLNLAELASDLGIAEVVDSYRISALTDVRVLDSVIDEIRDLRVAMPARKLAILDQYLFARNRRTLADLGKTFGVSRERIRQIKNQIAKEVEERVGSRVAVVVATIRRKAGSVVDEDDLRSLVAAMFEGEAVDDPAVDLARRIVEAKVAEGYRCDRGVCVGREATGILDEFAGRALELADDVGLVDGTSLRASLPDEGDRRLFELSVKRCGLVRIGDQLALRATKKARAKAAILNIGRPATLAEIVAESSLPRANLAGILSGIPGVARASKTKWGIDEWVQDEYKGIAAEIEQRIEDDGGATTMARLLRELPEMFEVKETSVRALAAAPRFVLRDGVVRLAEESEIELRDIRDVADGMTREGWPYWSFQVKRSYFSGYSLSGVPPEIADAIGCPKNGSVRAKVARPTRCGPVSVNWRLTSVSGTSVGYISTPLERLGVAEGDRVRLVVPEPGVVEFRVA